MTRLWKSCLVIMLLCANHPSARQAPDPQALAGRIQQHYDGVRDFRADFMHGYEGGVLRKKTVGCGTACT